MAPTLPRRVFLRAAGVALALPALEAFQPRVARGAEAAPPPRRMIAICTPLGLHAPFLFPEKAGADYAMTPYLDVIKDFKQEFTVMSGLAHPEVGSSHDSLFSFLTAAPHPERRGGFRNSISLDQLAAESIGGQTRFPSLTLSGEGFSLSWTRSGAIVPSDNFPAQVFARLFLEGRPEEVRAQARRLRDGQSILDAVGEQARSLGAALGGGDREKLEEYFTSVRELERNLARSEDWSKRPKPKVDAKQPVNVANPADVIAKSRAMFDLMHLAVQTDSTRLMTMLLPGVSQVPVIPGVSQGHHDLSHHGQDSTKIEQLKTVEIAHMKIFGELLGKLRDTKEGDASLLDRTMVYLGSNLGNASSHAVKNLPVILAGGGFKHGQHLAFDAPKGSPAGEEGGSKKLTPLSNLYVSMLQRLGIEADRFGTSTGTLTGLEMAGT